MGVITGNGSVVTGLGGARGFGETALARGDEGFARVDVSAVFENDFFIRDTAYAADQLYISTDGFVTFGHGVAALPGKAKTLDMPFIGLFMADVDTRLDGEGAESGQIWIDVDTAQDCVTITWDDVGFYRRNATATNTFQLQLFDRGGGAMDAVFRYDDIEWTTGDLQGGSGGLDGKSARIGYRMNDHGRVTYLGPSGDGEDLTDLPTTPGNTGVAGLYVFRLGGAPVPIAGGVSNDVIFGTVDEDNLQGQAGNDRLMGSWGADQMNGGSGKDVADYSGSTKRVVIDLLHLGANRGWAEGDSYLSVESYIGTNRGDKISGDGGADRFFGGNGADFLRGRGGKDVLTGGKGNDKIYGGSRADTLFGDDGHDTLLGGSSDDSLRGGGGNDTLRGGIGADRFVHSGTSADGHDWIIDYSAAERDLLVFDRSGASADQFRVDFRHTGGENLDEAYITYLPTGQLLWILQDAEDQNHIFVQSGSRDFDLL